MDPYLTLGVNRSASQEAIDTAFKALMEKYSSENYSNGPMMSLAEKKRKELEDAYDAIIQERAAEKREQGTNSQNTDSTFKSASSSNAEYTSASSNPQYARVRECINTGNTIEAQRLLQAISKRDAEWFYLSGCVALRNGMYNDAYSFFKTASNKEPQNDEYRAAYMRMEKQAGSYRSYGSGADQQDCCNCCSNLIIADCCCECLGGDLISCC